jgi:hypothetical protein
MWHVAGAVVAFAALAGTGIAYASIPGPDAVIHKHGTFHAPGPVGSQPTQPNCASNNIDPGY